MSGAPSRSGPRVPAVAPALAVASVWYLAFIVRASVVVDGQRWFPLFDDAMVSMRYARNLAEGHGLVWNPGERVEGYSNFAWTLAMAAVHAVGFDDRLAPLVVAIVSGVVLLATVAVAERLARKLSGSWWVRAVAALAVACCYPLTFWSLRGMEVGLVALCLAVAVLAASALGGARPRRAVTVLSAALALVVLTRDDTVVPVVALLALLAVWPRSYARRRLLVPAAAVVAAVAAHAVLRLALYGHLVPNTYALKVTGVALTDRLGRGLTSLSAAALLEFAIPLALVAALVLTRRADRTVALALTPVAAVAAVSVVVGGDAWEFFGVPNRYLTAALPLLLVVAVVACERLAAGALVGALAVALAGSWVPLVGPPSRIQFWPTREPTLRAGARRAAGAALLAAVVHLVRPRWVPRWLVAGIALVVAVNVAPMRDWARHNAPNVEDVDRRAVALGLAHRRHTSPDAVIAVVTAGTDPYLSRRPSVDLLGKSDATVARAPRRGPFYPGHDRYDYRYSVCELRPDLVVELWRPSAEELSAIRDCGYEPLGRGFVRADTDAATVDRDGLVDALGDDR